MRDNLKTEFEAAVDGMTAEQMPNEDLVDIAKLCGNNIAVALIKNCAGMYITVPKAATRKVSTRFIIDKFDGSNAKKLAFVAGVSLRNVYEIVEAEDQRRKTKNTKKEK